MSFSRSIMRVRQAVRVLWCALVIAAVASAAQAKPKLVLFVVVDQFRYDYLTRFRSEYTGGLDRLLKNGAVFTDAQCEHFPTLTAPGHATMLTGAMPSATGIVGNDWYDREAGQHTTSVSDDTTQLVGGSPGKGSSPRRLLVPTVGDQLKAASSSSRVIGISLKDRSAILLAGRKADSAYWFDIRSGNFVTSTYYMSQVPLWAKTFNDSHTADHYTGATWLNHQLPKGRTGLYNAVDQSPFGNEFLEEFVERAIEAEQLGRHNNTDLLAVSFSSNDYVGHTYGPDSLEVHETSLRTDKLLNRLFEFVDHQVGLNNVLVVLTSDHGIAPLGSVDEARKMPGGRMSLSTAEATIQAALEAKYGIGQWVAGGWDLLIYLNQPLIAERKLDLAEVERTAALAVLRMPHIFRVYTHDQLAHSSKTYLDQVDRRVLGSFNADRGADLAIIADAFWMFTDLPTTHASPFSYDTQVPLIFWGPGIAPGSYNMSVSLNDIAPTISKILEQNVPPASTGRVLTEIFVPVRTLTHQ